MFQETGDKIKYNYILYSMKPYSINIFALHFI